MEVVLLGAGTGVPHPQRSSAALLVRDPSAGQLLLDSGDGTSTRLIRAGTTLDDLDAVFYSHLHVDHVGGLAALLFALRIPTDPPLRTRDLPLYGPAGFAAHFAQLEALWGRSIEPRHCIATVTELEPGTRLRVGTEGRFEVVAVEVEHDPDLRALGFRVSAAGRTLAYSGDVGPCIGLDTLLRGADLALVESSFPAREGTPATHLNAEQVAAAASRAGVPRLVVTHRYPECDAVDIAAQIRRGYAGEVILGVDGRAIVV